MNWNEVPVCEEPKTAPVNTEIQAIHSALLEAARYYDRNQKWSPFCKGKGDTCRDIAKKLSRFGSFSSDKQREFAMKLIEWAKGRQKKAERAEQVAAEVPALQAPIEAPKLIKLLEGLQHLVLGKLEIRRKYKTDRFWIIWANTCVGKIEDGELVIFPRGAGNEDILDALRRAEEDPREAIAQSGRETGQCAVCGHLLADPESIARGIGPECIKRIGG